MNVADEGRVMRRVAGYHDLRMDGMLDLVIRAKDCSVLDIGCNRGLVGFEMANNGAKIVHGCDNYENGIATARELFADLRNCKSKFECVDLTKGPPALAPFGTGRYDIVLMLATYHKIKRVMPAELLSALMKDFGRRTQKFLGWRGTSEDRNENEGELLQLDREFRECELKRIQTSYISQTLGVAAIWGRM